MRELGHTRGRRQLDHLLLTPDTFVRAALPGMQACVAIVHAGPAVGTGFTAYTAESQSNGELGPAQGQRFLYVMAGEVRLETEAEVAHLRERGYAFLPEGFAHRVTCSGISRIAVIEKSYQRLPSTEPPGLIVSSEEAVSGTSLDGDPDLQVKCLLPDTPNFDF